MENETNSRKYRRAGTRYYFAKYNLSYLDSNCSFQSVSEHEFSTMQITLNFPDILKRWWARSELINQLSACVVVCRPKVHR